MLVNIQALIDDARFFETVRTLRWSEGLRCPHSDSSRVTKQGRDDTQVEPQRSECSSCARRLDGLIGTIFAGHHQPLRVRILFLHFMGLNLSNEQIAEELGLNPDDAQKMAATCSTMLARPDPAMSR
jgi:transposase-like protein